MSTADIGGVPGAFDLIRGAAGRLQCAFEVAVFDRDSPHVSARLDTCAECDRAQRDQAGAPVVCRECKCPLKCASRVPWKACPLGKYPALTLDGRVVEKKEQSNG